MFLVKQHQIRPDSVTIHHQGIVYSNRQFANRTLDDMQVANSIQDHKKKHRNTHFCKVNPQLFSAFRSIPMILHGHQLFCNFFFQQELMLNAVALILGRIKEVRRKVEDSISCWCFVVMFGRETPGVPPLDDMTDTM